MAFRRPPRIFDGSSVDWDSENEVHEDADDDFEPIVPAARSIRPHPQFQALNETPPLHPFLTDFGPNTLQHFLRDQLDQARTEARDFSAKTEEQQGMKLQPHRKPRPGFQRPLDTTRISRPAKMINPSVCDKEDDEEAAADGDDEHTRLSTLRPRPRPVRTGVGRPTDDQEYLRPRTEPQPRESPTTPFLQLSPSERPQKWSMSPSESLHGSASSPSDPPRGIRRISIVMTEEDLDADLREPVQEPLGLIGASGRRNENSPVEIARSEDRAKLGGQPRQTHDRNHSANKKNPWEQSRNQHQELEVFQREERRRFARATLEASDKDTTQSSPRTIQPRRSSRNTDFEEYVNAKRQSWREEELSSSRAARPGTADAEDKDEDDSLVRKSPSRNNALVSVGSPLSTRRNNLAAAPSSLPLLTAPYDSAAELDGMRDDQSTFATSNIGASSSPMAEQPEVRRSRRVALANSRRRGNRSWSPIAISDDNDDSVPFVDDREDLFSISLPRNPVPLDSDGYHKLPRPKLAQNRPSALSQVAKGTVAAFDYNQIVPEKLPKDLLRLESLGAGKNLAGPSANRDGLGRHRNGRDDLTASPSRRKSVVSPAKPPDAIEDQRYPRLWDVVDLPLGPKDPPSCHLNAMGMGWSDELSAELFSNICEYVSYEDVRNLRLVNRAFASAVAPVLFRSVVTKFGRSMFGIDKSIQDEKTQALPSGSMFDRLGGYINKFGIAFEVDLNGLQSAESKVIQKKQEEWWGGYVWPVPNYPRFPALESIEDLVDNNVPLVRDVLKHLSTASELALSIDSGHGWLNGPDLSDLAIYNMRCHGGSRVFKKTFLGENKWQEHGRNELLKWGQQNTLNESIKVVQRQHQNGSDRASDLQFLKLVAIRDYESFRDPNLQPDRDAYVHTGGRTNNAQQPPLNPHAPANAANLQFQAIGNIGLQPHNPGQHPNLPHWQVPIQPPVLQHQQNQHAHPPGLHQNPPANQPLTNGPALRHQLQQMLHNATVQGHHPADVRRRTAHRSRRPHRTLPQWPIIFNGYNLAAEYGGQLNFIQNKISPIVAFPLRPGHLTEAQAQWLMETVWAQRAFLSAYTTSIITNKAKLRNVHSLHIAKLSSGLLPSLAQREFWSALPGLKSLTIIISPDWRTEHIPGDRSYNTNMLIPPLQASTKLAEFLHQYIARIEHLSTLAIGFIGGGEHATGICARHQNILPAPITSEPRAWLTDHKDKPDMETIMKFDHIRELTFVNCWFSPGMFEAFMMKSRDTSLRHLVLDSVSLTGVNSSRNEGPLTAADNNLRPQFGRDAWLQERLPSDGGWPGILDRVTPGVTFFERKVAGGMIPEDQIHKSENQRDFRGNVEKITLLSVGYVKISGVQGSEFNQNGLVQHSHNPMDEGLRARKTILEMDGGDSEGTRRRVRRTVHANNNHNNAAGPLQLTIANQQAPPGGWGGILLNNNHPMEREASGPISTYKRIMMGRTDPETGSEFFGLGKMTQCVHPVEKRVLEGAWGMRFGWGEDMERWAAVEDGCFEGGTGRFSGVVAKEQHAA